MWNRLSRTAADLLLRRPLVVLSAMLGFVFAVELARYVPEFVPGGAAVGEVLRNLAYALIGATLFHWLIVELPARRRRRRSYEFHHFAFTNLLVWAPGLLVVYQDGAPKVGKKLDAWDKMSLIEVARAMDAYQPEVFGPKRAGLLRNVVEIGVPGILADLASSASYFDEEVNHALSQFPRQHGVTNTLQVTTGGAGHVDPDLDAHVVWTLLEAARRLYSELLATGAYDRTVFSGEWTTKSSDGVDQESIELSDEVLFRSR